MKGDNGVKVDYDSEFDLLYLRRYLGKAVTGSFGVGDFLFDLSNSGDIIGVQIDNASSQINTTPQILKNIKAATFSVMATPETIGVRYGIASAHFSSSNQFLLTREQIAIPC